MKLKFYLILFFFAFSLTLVAQQAQQIQHATLTVTAANMIEIPSIASQIASGQFIPAENIAKEYNPKHSDANKAVPGKGLPLGNDPLWQMQNSGTRIQGREPELIFDVVSGSESTPTDPTGAIGPNHYVNAWNSSFRIWDREGNPLTPPASLGSLFPGETLGDPIVMYDRYADRFIITQLSETPNSFLIAVSQGADPVNDGWYTFRFNSGSFADYPKFSVWSDGYYITANKNSGSAGTSEVVFALERDKLLLGDLTAQMVGFPLTNIVTGGFYSPLGFNANGTELPPAGNAPIVYMQDDSWAGVSTDHLKIWTVNVDWDNTGNSTISVPQVIPTTPFDGLFDGGSFSNLPQPSGPDLDALQATIMYMAQYRRFADHNSVVFNFVVDLDGNSDLAGIRWYELRQDTDGDPWAIYQEGTYAQPEGHSAYCGSIGMDVNGNIGMGYTVVSSTLVPSIRYTGRFANDPLSEMTVAEDVIRNGTESDPSDRYGDYAQLTIDPVDDKTFWHDAEYFTGGTRKNVVGVFKLSPDFSLDAGIIDVPAPQNGLLTNAEPITVTIRNFGSDSIYNFPVSYQIDGGDVITEMVEDTLPGVSNLDYTFTTPGDLSIEGNTYSLVTYTSLEADEDLLNDTLTVLVTHLFPNDIGIATIIEPVSGSDLSSVEPVTVIIDNYGGATQIDFNVSYTLNGATPVVEVVPGPLDGSSSMSYTFATTADFTNLGDYTLLVNTFLPGDSDTSNDSLEVIITKTLCQPEINCSQGDGFKLFKVGDIDNPSDCSPNGYGDFTDQETDLTQNSTNELVVTTNYGDQFVKVWIDFNDNFVFENSEVVVNNVEIADGMIDGTFTDTMNLVIPSEANLGQHIMRGKTNWDAIVPSDACDASSFGETEDYMANIVFPVGIDEQLLGDNKLEVSYLPGNHFVISLKTNTITETLIVTVHNVLGQKMIQNRVNYQNGAYTYDFDMSYAKAGVYLVRLGSYKVGKVTRIIVK